MREPPGREALLFVGSGEDYDHELTKVNFEPRAGVVRGIGVRYGWWRVRARGHSSWRLLRMIRYGAAGQRGRTVIDGPFAETKELAAGYWIWQVNSKEEAIEWLK